MSNGSRQTHCKRVFRLNDDGTIDPDIWIDLLRIDKLPANFQSMDDGIKGQVINLFFYFNDDPNHPMDGVDAGRPDVQGENANASRRTEKLEIKNPNSPDDKSQSNYLWIVDGIPLQFSGDTSGIAGQVRLLEFKNDSRNAGNEYKREFTVVKIVNNDLAGLKMADNDGSNPVLVDGFTYQQALKAGKTDDSQFLNVEIVDRSDFNFQSTEEEKKGQVITFILGNGEVENQFDSGDPQAIPPPVRTDPLQAIVNVQWGGLAVEFFDKAA